MITKERFIELMNVLTMRYKRQNDLIAKMSAFCSSQFIEEYFSADFLISYLDFIEEILTGEKIEVEGLLMACVIECDCDFNKMDFFDESGEKIPNNWGDVYEFLVS